MVTTGTQIKGASIDEALPVSVVSAEEIEALGQKHGLAMRHVGKLRDCGYPEEIALSSSDMLEFRLNGR